MLVFCIYIKYLCKVQFKKSKNFLKKRKNTCIIKKYVVSLQSELKVVIVIAIFFRLKVH